MKKIRTLTATIAALGITAATSVYANHCASHTSAAASKSRPATVVAAAQSSDQFETLVAAIQAAGLVEILQADGPYTVFAPTDDAFAKLPEGTVENLLKPENKEQLIAVLKYHVVPGKVMAADVKTMKATTVLGQEVQLKVSNEGVYVDNAKVVQTDLLADNGVIHVIDTVILPKS